MKVLFSFLLLVAVGLGQLHAAPAPLFSPYDKPFVHTLFTNNMVLQREVAAPVWGWTEPGASVEVAMGGKSAKATAGADGKWMVKIGPFEAGGPYEMMISGPQKVTLKNVMVGDVWVCSGQSNMEFGVKGLNQWWGEQASANLPNMRLAHIPADSEFEAPNVVDTDWKISSTDTVFSEKLFPPGAFSAIGFIFGREVHNATKIPIGLIESSLGATAISSWSKWESLKQIPEFSKETDAYSYYKKRIIEMWEKMDPAYAATKNWSSSSFDDKDWKTIELPMDFTKKEAFDGFKGIIWLRKEVEIPQSMAGKDIVIGLGPIDGRDTFWWDGEYVESWNSKNLENPRFYKIKADLAKPGKHVIAVRVHGNRGVFGAAEYLSVKPVGSKEGVPLAGTWKCKTSTPEAEVKTRADVGRYPERRDVPAGCYQAMIKSIAPFAIKGVIWYQGEGNIGMASTYYQSLSSMIKDWREDFGVGDFPFYIVQISGLGQYSETPKDSGWSSVREAQARAARDIPNCGMAVSVDRGEIYDIHPPNKKDVGKRLALVALAKTYKKDVEYAGPTFKSAKVEGNSIRVSYDFVGGGLISRGGTPIGFEIAGADKKYEWAHAVIDGETVVVTAPNVPKPEFVRYAWGDHPLTNLYNKADLPAAPFRSDQP